MLLVCLIWSIQNQDIDKSEEWLSLFLQSDYNILGYGESEYLAGKIAFEKGNLANAKKWFISANQKSGGRVWNENEDKKYSEFFEANCADLVRPKELEEMLSAAIKEIDDNHFSCALSLLYDCLNIELDNAAVHFNKGVCHLELNELEHAADSFTRVYMLEGKEIFSDYDSKYFSFLKAKIEVS